MNALHSYKESLPEISLSCPAGIFINGLPEYGQTKSGKEVLTLKGSIALGGTLFPLSLNIEGENYPVTPKKWNGQKGIFETYSKGWKVFGNIHKTKEFLKVTLYVYEKQEEALPKKQTPLEVLDFKEMQSPFVGKHRIGKEVQGLYGKEIDWIQIDKRLPDNLILQARNGKTLVSYFSTHSPNVFGVDLDIHDIEKPWSGKGITETLKSYGELVQAMKCFPSFVYKSRRGIHAFWSLDQKAPIDLIKNRLLVLFDKEGISNAEILPTAECSLRIDSITSYIDPKTLKAIKNPRPEEIKRYTLPEIFSSEENIKEWQRPNERRERYKALRQQSTIEKLENDILPITKSNTLFNDCPILPAYYKAGLSIEEAVSRVQRLLILSNYKGELENNNRLHTRVRSAWKNFEKKGYSFTGIRKDRPLNLTDTILIENLLNQASFSKQKENTVREFLLKLLGWIHYQEDIKKNPKEFELWSYFYSFRDERNRLSGYRVFAGKGWIPIPSTMLWNWYSRYSEILSWLKESEILTPMTGYSIEKSQCRYFEVKTIFEVRKNHKLDLIEELRACPLTQKELSEVLGISRSFLSEVLTGRKQPSNELFSEMSQKWETYIETINTVKSPSNVPGQGSI